MKTQKIKVLNFIRLSIVGLLILSVATFAAAQKRTTRQTPVKRQFQTVTVEGATFTFPANWKKSRFTENLWTSRDDLSLSVSIYVLTPEDVVKAGGYSIERDLEIFYESHKRGGTEDVRYLQVGGVKGVHFLNDSESFTQNNEAYQTKSVKWLFERMYQGQRQLGNITISVPARDFEKNKAALYRILNSIKFAKK